MEIWELFIIAVGLAMDAFAVAVCKGLSAPKITIKHSITAGAYFGGFQAFMPLIGFFLGRNFQSLVESVDHWIAFVLLSLIAANIIKEAFSKDEEVDASFGFKAMLPLAVATSIDALAVGITFAFLSVNIVPAVSFIGIVTFLLSAVGVFLGSKFGAKYKSKAEFAGGVVLILMGTKILLEHLGVLA